MESVARGSPCFFTTWTLFHHLDLCQFPIDDLLKLVVGQPFGAPTTTYLSSVQGSADSVLLHPKLVEGSHSGHFIPPRDDLGCHAVLLECFAAAQTQFHDQKRP